MRAPQLEARNPAFGPRLQRCDLVFRQIQACDVVEERDSLVDRKTQVRCSYLRQLTTCAETTERQRGIGVAGDDQV